MTAGVPGLGLSGLFTLLSALVLPMNRRRAPSPIGHLVVLAVSMGATLILTSEAVTDAVAAVGRHIAAPHGRHLAGIVVWPAIWQAPVIVISAAIMVVVLAIGEALLHLVGPKLTPTPPPIRTVARPEPGHGGSPAPGGCLIRVGGAGSLTGMALTDRDRAILDFERSWWSEPGPKELAIRERFDLSSTRYYELLNEMLDMPEALDYDPLVVRRLRRLRDRRRRARYEGRSADRGGSS